MVKMLRMSKNDREHEVGMLESGCLKTDIMQRLGVYRTTIARLWAVPDMVNLK